MKTTKKIKSIPKKATGGAKSNPCPGIGKCWDGTKCIDCRKAAAGVIGAVTGSIGVGTEMIRRAVKESAERRKENKMIRQTAKIARKINPELTKKESKNIAREARSEKNIPKEKKGGSIKYKTKKK